MSLEEQGKRRKEMIDRFRQASPEKRKEMLEQVPEEWRGPAKDTVDTILAARRPSVKPADMTEEAWTGFQKGWQACIANLPRPQEPIR
jgi:hypothetical protein